ncbi:hypothetical protein [Candidatus Solirubrobacter pratensis]|uniref:hypothetical protein n=1 Tax=Candidatus Solirubrobacter pratensis TaxID=1298857 RepID=UPI00040F3B27|nr:hypothetical protein [Candidatus Solirubrobacter pratensis]
MRIASQLPIARSLHSAGSGQLRSGRWWAGLDADVALARRYRTGVLGVLLGTPRSLQRCRGSVPEFSRFRCPESGARRYARYVGEIVRSAGGASCRGRAKGC